MDQPTKLTNRRGALARIFGVAFGAAGMGAVAGAKAVEAEAAPGTLSLYAPGLRLKKVGERSLPSGQIVDADGRAAGMLHTAVVDSTAGSLVHHTFTLDHGSLQGIGSNGTYVLIGGTGCYLGAAGSYVERPAGRLGCEYHFSFRKGTTDGV